MRNVVLTSEGGLSLTREKKVRYAVDLWSMDSTTSKYYCTNNELIMGNIQLSTNRATVDCAPLPRDKFSNF